MNTITEKEIVLVYKNLGIIGCRPEDGALKRWLYTEAGQPEKYVELY